MIKIGKIIGSFSMVAVLGLVACANQSGLFSSDQNGGLTTLASTSNNQLSETSQKYLAQLEKSGAKLNQEGNQVAVVMPENTQFRSNSSVINKNLRRQLDTVAMLLKAEPNSAAQIKGNADSADSTRQNNRLAHRRTRSVISYLKNHGVDRKQLQTVAANEGSAISNAVSSLWSSNKKALEITISLNQNDNATSSNQDANYNLTTDSQYSG